MQNTKRITLLCGHYGSGKTNVALNLAMRLRERTERVAIADLDIVNPYFRTKDSRAELLAAGIRLISSEYAGSNVDIPALPPEMYALTDDRDLSVVIDVGGDDRGALALGRLAPRILAEGSYDMLLVINRYRPLTRDLPSLLEVMHEIESAAGMPFTGIVNNSNLGDETTPGDVLASLGYAAESARATGLPIRYTAFHSALSDALNTAVPNPLPLVLQKKPI